MQCYMETLYRTIRRPTPRHLTRCVREIRYQDNGTKVIHNTQINKPAVNLAISFWMYSSCNIFLQTSLNLTVLSNIRVSTGRLFHSDRAWNTGDFCIFPNGV